MKLNNITIIIADDDQDDKLLIQEALEDNGIGREDVVLTSDGEELVKVLRNYNNEPCIVFLDLNMPRKDGRQALKEIKSDPALKHIPVLIFTTSAAYDDIVSSYRSGGNTYFTKPSRYADLVEIIRAIKSYWLEHATLQE